MCGDSNQKTPTIADYAEAIQFEDLLEMTDTQCLLLWMSQTGHDIDIQDKIESTGPDENCAGCKAVNRNHSLACKRYQRSRERKLA